MNRQALIAVVVVVMVVLAGMWFISNRPANAPTNSNTPTSGGESVVTPTALASASASGSATQGSMKEFTVTGSNFKFDPATLTVNKGDAVKITYKSGGGTHDFVLPDFEVQSKQISSGASDTVTFTASKTGSFEYFCSVGNHRAMGMKGTLTVK